MNKLMACALALLGTTACGDGTDDRCVDGVYDGTAVLTSDGFVFEEYPSLLSPGSTEVVPYSASPFLSCRVLGGILMQSADAVLDSEHYPVLEELGFITIEPLDGGIERIVDDLSGFDDVVRFGGIGNPFSLTRQASIRTISGFNSVEVIEGSVMANGTVTGFGALRVVEGSYDVADIVDQTQLERVGGTLDIGAAFEELAFRRLESIGGDLLVQGARVPEVGFPALREIGGDVVLQSSDRFERWTGLANGAVIEGDFLARSNSPIRDAVFEEWVLGDVTIRGAISICGNRPPDEEGGCFEQ